MSSHSFRDTLGVPSLRHARRLLSSICSVSFPSQNSLTCSMFARSLTPSVSQLLSHLAPRPTPLSSLNLPGFIDGLVQLSSYTRFISRNRRLACRDLQRDIVH